MPYVSRAIIMAAGTGTRLYPATENVPKPLLYAGKSRFIDTLIRGLHENGITEIYIVVGYLKEQFESLKEEYGNITLIENPYYETCNNISSLYVAREHLYDCIIMDGDQFLFRSDILSPFFERSGYCSMWTETATNEWLQCVDDGRVTSCSRTGGERGWQLFGVSFWSKEDGGNLKRLVEVEFEEKKRTDIYWDDIAMFCYPEQFNMGIRPIEEGSIIEIDTYEELLAFRKEMES